MIKCRAVEYINAVSAGALGITPIQLNSCDDPFTSVGAGQPLGYDQWKALYKSAFVVASKVTVRAHNNGSVAVIIGLTPTKVPQGTTALTSYEHYMENPSTKSRILSQDLDHTVFSHAVSVKRFLSLSKIRDDDNSRIDLVNETPPTRTAYWHLWAQALDATGTIDVDIVAQVDYTIVLTDPIIPSRSVET